MKITPKSLLFAQINRAINFTSKRALKQLQDLENELKGRPIMARPGFMRHRKFLRLCKLLNMPQPHVRGHIELLWESGYENGNPYLGDSQSVALAAQWPEDDHERFTKALVECGLPKNGMIEIATEEDCEDRATRIDTDDTFNRVGHNVTPIIYQIHDFWHHCPGYVYDREKHETTRQIPRKCFFCGNMFHSSRSDTKFCTDSCKSKHHRQKTGVNDTDRHGSVTDKTFRHPSPAPAPAPAPIKITPPPAGRTTVTDEPPKNGNGHKPEYPPGLTRFWTSYPAIGRERSSRKDCAKVWAREQLEVRVDEIIESLGVYIDSPSWSQENGKFIPGAHRWLSKGKYDEKPRTDDDIFESMT